MPTTNRDDPVHRLRYALIGFLGAWDRCADLGLTPDPDELAVPVTEALWWGRNVDEWFERLDGSAYRADRDASPDGRCVLGVRFARNRSHEHALAVERPDGFKAPFTAPIVMGKVIWRPRREFSPDRPDPLAAAAYEERLQGMAPASTLTCVARWFTHALLDRPGAAASGLSSWWSSEVSDRPVVPG